MSDMKTPWTRDGCAIRDADGETVGLFMGNGGYMAAARWPKAEHVLHCVNSHDALDARVRELEAALLDLADQVEEVVQGNCDQEELTTERAMATLKHNKAD